MTPLENHLHNLTTIEPDGDFARRTRKQILGDPTIILAPARTPWRLFQDSVRFGSAIALASVLLVVAAGGLATWQFMSPLSVSSLDPAGLRAEAQAIDIQIEVADIGYAESSVAQSTPATSDSGSLPQSHVDPAPSKDVATTTLITDAGSAATTTPTQPLSINEALDLLTK